jgi:OmpA-OmpF porin, OOP family
MVLSLIGSTSALFAQGYSDTTKRFDKKNFRTWSIGLNGGMLTHFTPLNNLSNGDFKTPQETLGYGGYIKKQILPSFGLQADFLAGTVKGFRSNSLPAGSAAQDASSFKTTMQWAVALSGNLTLANLSLNTKRGVITPYATGGVGVMSTSANVINTPNGASNTYDESIYIPVGAGIKFGLSKGLNIDLGYSVNFVKSNRFDGVLTGLNDRFSYAHAGIEIAIGRKKSPQLQNYSALAALREESAAESAELRARLTAAEQARMQEEQARLALAQQYAREMGDDDADGVANKFDKCAGTAAGTQVDGAGCPLKVPAPVVVTKERVIVTESDRRVVGEAIKNLEFDLGKATIKARSYATLNRVADLLKEKSFSLKLAGHTDNTGSMALNMGLSKDRAEAVKAYLVSQGANASLIEATGYGPNQPIATNKTAAGRQQNRRVEFSLN